MGIGYFLRLGDRTTCGGQIVTGCDSHLIDGLPAARVGDKYICGKDGKQYFIVSGIPDTTIMDLPAAGTEHSIGSCSCSCKFIASCLTDIYGFESEYYEKPRATKPVQPIRPMQPEPASAPGPGPVAKSQEEPRIPVDSGFCVLPFGTTPKIYDPWFFANPKDGVKNLFFQLNPERQKKPGSILIVVDPEKKDSNQILNLQQARDKIDKALESLSIEEAKLLYDNRAAVDIFSSQIHSESLGTSGSILGAISEVGSGYYGEINKTLKEIQDLYKNAYASNNRSISGQEFFGHRQRLFDKLDTILNRYSKEQLNLAQYEEIKKALGLSTSSIMHKWNQSGITDIEGYASYIEKSAKLMKVMRTTGYVGLGLDFAAYTENVYDACSKGREDACRKAALVEYGKFGSKQALSLAAGSVSAWAARSACLWVLGLATSEVGGIGAGICLVTGIAASIGGGNLVEGPGEKAGEKGGEIIYDKLFNGE